MENKDVICNNCHAKNSLTLVKMYIDNDDRTYFVSIGVIKCKECGIIYKIVEGNKTIEVNLKTLFPTP